MVSENIKFEPFFFFTFRIFNDLLTPVAFCEKTDAPNKSLEISQLQI
jgi:hypothetical protein